MKFGEQASEAARIAARVFHAAGVTSVLDLGCGPGRDALYFARLNSQVTALDYSRGAVTSLTARASREGLGGLVRAHQHDLREALAFTAGSFDAVYSHMFLCMEFTEAQLSRIVNEIRRVARPGGLHFFTVRSSDDPDFGTGRRIDETMFDVDGYVIRFFDEEQVRQLCGKDEIIFIQRLEEGPKRLLAALVTIVGP